MMLSASGLTSSRASTGSRAFATALSVIAEITSHGFLPPIHCKSVPGIIELQIYADAAKSVRVMALVVHPYIMGAPHRLNISAACSKSSARRAT